MSWALVVVSLFLFFYLLIYFMLSLCCFGGAVPISCRVDSDESNGTKVIFLLPVTSLVTSWPTFGTEREKRLWEKISLFLRKPLGEVPFHFLEVEVNGTVCEFGDYLKPELEKGGPGELQSVRGSVKLAQNPLHGLRDCFLLKALCQISCCLVRKHFYWWIFLILPSFMFFMGISNLWVILFNTYCHSC